MFDSPHSGRDYPDDFNFACKFEDLEKIEDRYVDDLFSNAPDHGATLLAANFPRSYIDANRAADDIDENLLGAPWPDTLHGPIYPTPRSDSGIGLISRLIRPGTPIYDRPLQPEEIMNRIRTCYEPYHDTLRTLIDQAFYSFGQVWHINCHSMPVASAFPKRNIRIIGGQSIPSDFVLGDRDGTTCSPDFTRALTDHLRREGFRVTVNDPFRGVELIRRSGLPTRGRHSLQIEINRSLYMNEETGAKRSDYGSFKAQIDKMIRFCTAYAQDHLTRRAAD
ncbi:MAG: N-formylglutamate amidohydrolase [Alphaproteobacteria bacterium]|nr:N-formylglutamate amidohydrolase [Alphaproteobacteria bacterium]